MKERIGRLIIEHPGVTGAAVAVLVGWCGFNAYRMGVLMGQVHGLCDDGARAASEVLGG